MPGGDNTKFKIALPLSLLQSCARTEHFILGFSEALLESRSLKNCFIQVTVIKKNKISLEGFDSLNMLLGEAI